MVPSEGHTGLLEAFDLGCEEQLVFVLGIVEGLCAKAIAGGEKGLFALVPKDKGEFAFEMVYTRCAMAFVEMDEDFAISSGAEGVAEGFEVGAGFFKTVELTVHDGDDGCVFVGVELGT